MFEDKPTGFQLPDIWNDDDAMYSLMQPIRRSKLVDPINYNTKITFWKRTLLSYAKSQKAYVVCINSLQKLFTRHFPVEGVDLFPQSLGEVITEMESEGLLEPVVPPRSIIGNIFTALSYVVHQPALWAYQYLSGQQSSSKTESDMLDQQFVLTELAESSAADFMSWFHENYCDQRLLPHSPVYDLDVFNSALSRFYSHTATREYIWNLLKNIKRCVSVEITSTENAKPIQIVRVGENINTRPAKPPNSETAKMESSVLSGIIQLKTTIGQLENEEERLETTIEQNRAQIKSLLMNKKNLEAKSLLRRTKVLEKSLNQKQTQLNNLEKMLLDIQSAAENRNIVRVLGSVNEALKLAVGGSDALNKAEDIVSDVMESIHESQEISDALSSYRHNSLNLEDMSDLEQELNDFLSPPKKPLSPEKRQRPNYDDLEAELASLTLSTDIISSLPNPNSPSTKKNPVLLDG
uniref:Charged multivesicular body protein 7 n=1 Tax=Trichobilharzia regenti TaxID=157069 RepID=A0AA85JSD7_TRIRE|nr:unnamed protein product [Trichobilharzia regenti]